MLDVTLLLPTANLVTAFRISSFLSGKLIVLLLFVFSITAWSVMLAKAMELARAARASQHFLAAFRAEKHPLSLYVKRTSYPDSPLFKVYEAGCLALGGELSASGVRASDLFGPASYVETHRLNNLQIEVVRRATERAVADEALNLESRMGVLATAVSLSPMLGLLGTVWGVLDAFAAMAAVGSAHLGAVAPGISAALLTTVVGLFVAIPSAAGYNLLTNKIRKLAVQMDNFAQEFVAELQRTFVRE